jgi:hypothetical protein
VKQHIVCRGKIGKINKLSRAKVSKLKYINYIWKCLLLRRISYLISNNAGELWAKTFTDRKHSRFQKIIRLGNRAKVWKFFIIKANNSSSNLRNVRFKSTIGGGSPQNFWVTTVFCFLFFKKHPAELSSFPPNRTSLSTSTLNCLN